MVEVSSRAREIAAEQFSDSIQPKHQLGPDYVIRTNEFRTWNREGAISIPEYDTNDELQIPESVVSYFRKTVNRYPNVIALTTKRNGTLATWTYIDYWNEVRTAAKGFIKLGLRPYHGVCILGYNAPEWFISYLAAIFAGGCGAGIYTTNSSEASYHVLNDSLANIVVVENEIQLKKILQIREKLPNLKAIIQYSGKPTVPDVLSWSDLIHIGNSVPEEILERRIKGIAVNQCCTLIYTSGTTGNAKGVMMSHDNILYMLKLMERDFLKFRRNNAKLLSYLPLSHIAALAADVYGSICIGDRLHFAAPDSLKGNLVGALREGLPTMLMGVPRIFEKVYEKMKEDETQMSAPKRQLFKWAQRQAQNYYKIPNNNSKSDFFFLTLARKFVLNKVKAALGLQNIVFLLCAGAPLATEVHNYFFGLDVPLLEGYAQSESSGLHVVNTFDHLRIGSVGKPDDTKKFEIKIASPDEDGAGEILLRGRNVFMGYMNLEDKTIETIDDERWLHSGDVGKVDGDGYLYITGRIKELIITAGGENIPPVLIEDIMKKLNPAISNCMLLGDKRKYLTMLISLKTKVDPETMKPLDKLDQTAIKWCRSLGSDVSSVSEILKTKDEAVMSAIQLSIDEYNIKHAISHAQRIQKWKILSQDFSIPGGELGPTSKLRRPFIVSKYSDIIEQMYAD